MRKKEQTVWTSITHDLKNAALLPQQRPMLLSRALQQMSASLPVAGMALVWPSREKKVLWKGYYVGSKRDVMQSWLSARLGTSLDTLMGVLQHDSARSPLEIPQPLLSPLRILSDPPSGLWIIWIDPSAYITLDGSTLKYIEHVHLLLEAVLEVESREEQYFSPGSPLSDREFIEALAHGSNHALSTFLSLTRIVAGADFTFWAQTYQDIVEITGHLGARHGGFGFTLLRGQGVGGRVAAYGTIVIGDYRTSPYRDASVCELVDRESIRSGIALPVHYSAAHATNAHVAAVLYATRRTESRFSQAECLLIQRLARLLEPLPFTNRPVSFFSPGIQQPVDHKAEWYNITLHSNQIEDVETWISQFIKGPVIITDSEDIPYIFAHSEQLAQMQVQSTDRSSGVQKLSLAAPGVNSPGQIYLHSSVGLPPVQWPDFFADLVMVSNLVILRRERTQEQLDRQREQWLNAFLQGKPPKYIENDGYRLGLPIEHGQLWVLAWSAESAQELKTTRKRMNVENVILEILKSPLLFLGKDLAVILLEKQAVASASRVRNALLQFGVAMPFWIVQGGQYHSFLDLKVVLTRAISLAQKARREKYSEYLLDIATFGLDSLLANPGLTQELSTFAIRLLAPLLEYDSQNRSHLTETLVLTRTLGSAQAVAEQLAVHVNTIRYRLHRAEDILGKDQTSPKEQTAITLAAFIWQHFHSVEQPVWQKRAEREER